MTQRSLNINACGLECSLLTTEPERPNKLNLLSYRTQQTMMDKFRYCGFEQMNVIDKRFW